MTESETDPEFPVFGLTFCIFRKDLYTAQIIANVIDKTKLSKQYVHPMNPYEVALLLCMERLHGSHEPSAASGQTKGPEAFFESRCRPGNAQSTCSIRNRADSPLDVKESP